MTEKAPLRQQFSGVNAGESPAQTAAILALLQALPHHTEIFCYVSMPDESDTRALLQACLAQGRPLSVPRLWDKHTMKAHRLTELSDLREGPYGIPQPPETAPVVEQPGLIVVPGLAFDLAGIRLGRGGGYYDRYLSARSVLTIGLCCRAALLPVLPRAPWDVPVRLLAMEDGLWSTNKEGEAIAPPLLPSNS